MTGRVGSDLPFTPADFPRVITLPDTHADQLEQSWAEPIPPCDCAKGIMIGPVLVAAVPCPNPSTGYATVACDHGHTYTVPMCDEHIEEVRDGRASVGCVPCTNDGHLGYVHLVRVS